jgi:hypothetical protein
MRAMKIPVSHPPNPNPYLIGFAAAAKFPEECTPVERISTEYPLGSLFLDPETYFSLLAPEIIVPMGPTLRSS